MNSLFQRWAIIVLLGLATTSWAFTTFAQSRKHAFENPFVDLPNYKWTNEPWNGDERPFAQMRKSIDQTVSKIPKERLGTLVERYRTSAIRQPRDPLKQFVWGYAAYKAVANGYRLPDRYHELQDINFALHRAKSPRTYEYARLRFLSVLLWRSQSFELENLGQRLLRRNPNDYSVKYRATDTFNTRASTRASKQNRQIALSYARDLVRLHPKRSSAHAALGAAYVSICLYDDDIAAGDKAIAAYNKFFQLQPKSDMRRDIQHWINRVRAHQNKLSKTA